MTDVIWNSLWHPSVLGDNGVSAPESVCFGIAVLAVAKQSNTRAAKSVAVATGEDCDCFCGHWLCSLPPVLPLLLPLVPSLSLAQFYAGPYSFQVCGIQASGFQVTLADVFVPERWSACWSGARGELTIHDVLRNPAILHSADMAEPA